MCYKLFIIMMTLGVVALLATACAGGDSSEPVATPSKDVVSPTATTEPTSMPEPTATATLEPTATTEPTPMPTPTMEPPSANPVPGTCLFFEQKYCDKGVLLEYESVWGGAYRVVFFNLPSGAAIFAPVDSRPAFSGGRNYDEGIGIFGKGVSFINIAVSKSYGEQIIQVNGNMTVIDGLNAVMDVAKGERIGTVSETGSRILENYNIAVIMGRYLATDNELIMDEEFLREVFPNVSYLDQE